MSTRQIIISILIFTCIAFLAPIIFPNFGVFFGWELGTIIQSIYCFIKYSKQSPPPGVSQEQKHLIDGIIEALIIIPLLLYVVISWAIIHKIIVPSNYSILIRVTVRILTDTITIIPMLTFFIANIILLSLINKKAKHAPEDNLYSDYAKFLKNAISLVDIPCLIPYLIVLAFAIYFAGSLSDVGIYISGAGSILLMTSNILSLSIYRILRESPNS